MKESPPPEPNPLPVAVAPVPLAIAPSQIPIKGNIGMPGTPAGYHPGAVAAAPAPSPVHIQMQHFAPRPGPPPTPHQGQLHLQPQPQAVPMHVPHPGMPQMQPSPHFQPHAYPPQYGAQQPQAPPPMQYQTPNHMAPVFDQHHRPVHPAPPSMTPARQPMAPTPNIAALPHANAHTGHVYNVPRGPEVFTLAENVDAAIPKEVREQFQRDENDRVLFFTAPPLARPENRVAEQYSGLGHSVSHLASIKQLREERARKRKERDEAIAREQQEAAANKPTEDGETKTEEPDAQTQQEQPNPSKRKKTQAELAEELLLGWAAEMDRGTKALEDAIGIDAWREAKRQDAEARRTKTAEQLRAKNLQWFFDDCVRRGTMSEEERRKGVETFVKRG